MDEQQTIHLERQNRKFITDSFRTPLKKQTDYTNSSNNIIQEIINILSKQYIFRSRDDINVVAIAIKQTQFYNYYRRELEEIPAALRQIVEGMTFEQFQPCEKIYTEKDRAKKVYIILQGEVCILSQHLKKDRFKNLNEIKHHANIQNKLDDQNHHTDAYLQYPLETNEQMIEKFFMHNYSQNKMLEQIQQFGFFGDTDVRHMSKYSFSAVAKTKVDCAVISQEVFNNYLGQNSYIAKEVVEIQKCSLFKFLDPQYIEYCLKYSQELALPIGTTIFNEGDSSSEVYYIKQGDLEQSIKPLKQMKKEQQIKEISTNIAAPSEEYEQGQDDFDPEKFLKSNLFNQTLYEKGGPVGKNRQFWSQADEDDFSLVLKLKKELEAKKQQFQKMGIKHTNLDVEDELKKYMVSSLLNKYNKNLHNNSFLKKAIGENKGSDGLKLSVMSQGSYFGDEVLSNHPLLKSSIVSSNNNKNADKSTICSSQDLKPLSIHHKIHKKNFEKQKTHENYYNNNQQNHIKQNQSNVIDQKQDQINSEEDKNESKQQKINLRKYTVKCKSAQCCLIKITMEIYLSMTYLNQKQYSASKYLQSELKQQRRQSKLEDHAQLIQLSNNTLNPKDMIKQRHKSILSDKIMEYIHNNKYDQSTHNSIDSSQTPKRNLDQSHYKDQNTDQNKISTTEKLKLNQIYSTKTNREKNISMNNSRIIETDLLNSKLKYRHSIAHSTLGFQTQLQDNCNSPSYQNEGTLTPNSNKKNYIFFNSNNSSANKELGSYMNKRNSDFNGSKLPSLNQKNSSHDFKRKKNIFNYSNQDSQNDIHSPQPIIPQLSPKQSKMKEEIDHLYQTFSTIIQNEEKRQKEMSLMTNSFEKLKKPTTPNHQDSYKYSPLLSPNLSNKQESIQDSQRPQISPNSPIGSGQVNTNQKNYFFRPSYQELKSLMNNQAQQSNTLTTFFNTVNNPQSMSEQNNNLKINFNKQNNSQQSNTSMNFEFNEDLQFGQNSNSSKQQIIPSLSEVKKSSLLQYQEDIQQQNMNRNIITKANSIQHSLGVNLNIGLDYTQNLLKEKMSPNLQNCIPFMKKKSLNQSLLLLSNQQQSPSINSLSKRLDTEPERIASDKQSILSFEKNSPINSPNIELNTFSKSKFTYDLKDIKEDLQLSNKSMQKNQSINEKTHFPLPQSYVLKPLFNEIIEKEKIKQQKIEKPQRVKIEIYRDFYIKKYRKAYKEAINVSKKDSKDQVVSLFDNVTQSENNQKQKFNEEEYSLFLQKKLQIDKKFPNSQRAQKINEFFQKQLQKIDEKHKGEIMKCKRAKDINIITTNQLLNKLQEQNNKHEMDLKFAGTYFNFVGKDIDNSSNKVKQNQNKFHLK